MAHKRFISLICRKGTIHLPRLVNWSDFLDLSTNIHALKLPAGCSMSLQPNDVMKSFSTLKKKVKESAVRNTKINELPLKAHMVAFKAHLEEYRLDEKSITTYTHFLYLLDFYVPDCYRESVILNGWAITGLGGRNKYDTAKIMSQWPGWGGLIPETQQQPTLLSISIYLSISIINVKIIL